MASYKPSYSDYISVFNNLDNLAWGVPTIFGGFLLAFVKFDEYHNNIFYSTIGCVCIIVSLVICRINFQVISTTIVLGRHEKREKDDNKVCRENLYFLRRLEQLKGRGPYYIKWSDFINGTGLFISLFFVSGFLLIIKPLTSNLIYNQCNIFILKINDFKLDLDGYILVFISLLFIFSIFIVNCIYMCILKKIFKKDIKYLELNN